MGIPSYFSHIIKNYKNIIRSMSYIKTKNVHHLFMDCNSIIYDILYSYPEQPKDYEPVIQRVIDTIEMYIQIIGPLKTAYIAFDGVAPFAKMSQQRNRRYKSWFMNTAVQLGDDKPKINTSMITPGTEFMNKLSLLINRHFNRAKTATNHYQTIVSCVDKAGEGEHKLFDYLRSIDAVTDNVAIYGLDSDLIMLAIFHVFRTKNIYIFREIPEFIKSSIPQELCKRDNNSNYCFLDILELSNSILLEMGCIGKTKNRIFDYVFMCFLMGNDFLPHFPAFNIRTVGIQILLDTYRKHIGAFPHRVFIKDLQIQWKWVQLFLQKLADQEYTCLTEEYRTREKWASRKWRAHSPEERTKTFESIPLIFREREYYICPTETFWESRYYNTLFDTPAEIPDICRNYLEGLEWVFKYYTVGCPDWQWKYNYHYPPLISDLVKQMSHHRHTGNFITMFREPLTAEMQLLYVYPREYLCMTPNDKDAFLTKYGEYYPEHIEFEWAFCKYFWEAHVKTPEIPVAVLHEMVGHLTPTAPPACTIPIAPPPTK
jgi:5'-3' exonuclease